MRAIQLHRHGKIASRPLVEVDLQVPEVAENQILIQVKGCGICHTDLHEVEGEIIPSKMPIVPGHQVVGRVEVVGPGNPRWKVGDRVGVPWLYCTCGKCDHCRRGEENLCEGAQFTGFHVDGGYAEYLLADADYALPLPSNLDDLSAAPMLCAGIIGYRSLRKADVQPDERIGLVGFGASAHLAIQIANSWGCKVSVFTRSQSHRKLAEDLGAVWVGGLGDSYDEPLDRAVIFAPDGSYVPLMLERLRPGGTLAINAIHMSPIPEMPYQLMYGERTLRSVANATYQDGLEFLELVEKYRIRSTIQTYPLRDANRALQDLKESRINGAGVLTL